VIGPDDVRRLFAAADETELGPFVRLAVLTGLRRGELLGLPWHDVDLEGGMLHVTQTAQRLRQQGIVFGPPKTDRSRRAVALSAEAVAVLRMQRRRQAEKRLLVGSAYRDDLGLVFATAIGTPLEPGNVLRTWYRVRTAAGLPTLRIHDLRHAHATLMLAGGVHPKVVSERLGHGSVTVTLDTYSHVLPGLQAAAAERLDAILAAKPAETAVG
jgi:integrase